MPQLNYEQADAELKAQDWTLARIVKAEADAGDSLAKQVIGAINAGRAGAEDAQGIAADLYTEWRLSHEQQVAPIAYGLGHPPIQSAAPVVQEIEFIPSPAPTVGAPASVPLSKPPAPAAPPIKTPPATPAAAPAATGKRTRRSWKATDIMTLTQHFLSSMAATLDVNRSLELAATSLGRSVDEVQKKAVELGLIQPTAAPKRELNDDEKKQVEAVIAAIPADPLFVQYAIKALKAQS